MISYLNYLIFFIISIAIIFLVSFRTVPYDDEFWGIRCGVDLEVLDYALNELIQIEANSHP
jgi:hypothetical protein